MSFKLAPIHTWLYKKIEFQNELINYIINYCDGKGLIKDIDINKYGSLESGRMEDNIDEGNIHGWLQERVSLVENKLAYIVTNVLKDNPSAIEEIKKASYKFGEDNKMQNLISIKEAFNYLQSLLLNGMPCDRVNEIISEDENSIMWRETVDIHERYWTNNDGDPKHFDIIRENLINGIIKDSNLEYIVNENYELKRR